MNQMHEYVCAIVLSGDNYSFLEPYQVARNIKPGTQIITAGSSSTFLNRDGDGIYSYLGHILVYGKGESMPGFRKDIGEVVSRLKNALPKNTSISLTSVKKALKDSGYSVKSFGKIQLPGAPFPVALAGSVSKDPVGLVKILGQN